MLNQICSHATRRSVPADQPNWNVLESNCQVQSSKMNRKYVRFWERNLWFYASVATSLLTVLVVYALPSDSPLVMLRWVLGLTFVLLIPGYVMLEALFPKVRDMDGIERIVLSVGLSLVLVMLDGLLLNSTSWGIRLPWVVISLTILTVGLSIVGLVRRFGISVEACIRTS